MKLFTRYTRISLPIIMGVFILSGLGCYVWIDHLLIADFDDSLAEQSQKISLYTQKNGDFPRPGLTDDWLISYRLTNRLIKPYYQTTERYDPDDKDTISYRNLYFTYQKDGHDYLVVLSRSMEALEGLSRSIAMITVITLLSVIVVTLLLNHFVLKKLWKPFYHTLNQLREFKLGNQQIIDFSTTRTEEFIFMQTQLQSMIVEAENDYVMLKEFSENASHEIQTPISILRSKLDVIMQGENLSDQQTLAIQSSYQALRRLTSLGHSLLLLSKIENNQFQDKILIDMNDKISEKISQLEEICSEKQIAVHYKGKSALIAANADLIDILLNNVLGNATRHNLNGGIIEIGLKPGELRVSNSGNSEPIDPLRIYSRFYKKQQHATNNGLGLAIVKQICDKSQIEVNYSFIDQKHSFLFEWSF